MFPQRHLPKDLCGGTSNAPWSEHNAPQEQWQTCQTVNGQGNHKAVAVFQNKQAKTCGGYFFTLDPKGLRYITSGKRVKLRVQFHPPPLWIWIYFQSKTWKFTAPLVLPVNSFGKFMSFHRVFTMSKQYLLTPAGILLSETLHVIRRTRKPTSKARFSMARSCASATRRLVTCHCGNHLEVDLAVLQTQV